jgi:hypothetical protein
MSNLNKSVQLARKSGYFWTINMWPKKQEAISPPKMKTTKTTWFTSWFGGLHVTADYVAGKQQIL